MTLEKKLTELIEFIFKLGLKLLCNSAQSNKTTSPLFFFKVPFKIECLFYVDISLGFKDCQQEILDLSISFYSLKKTTTIKLSLILIDTNKPGYD